MFIPNFFSSIYCKNDLLPGKYKISLQRDEKYKIYMNKGSIRLMDTEETIDKNEQQMIFDFEPSQKGFKIKTENGHICKKDRDPGVVNCQENEGQFSFWDITSRLGGVIIHNEMYCLKKMRQVRSRKKDRGKVWNYLNAQRCNPINENNKDFIFTLENIEERAKEDEKKAQLLREDEGSSSSSSSSGSDSSSDDDSSFSRQCKNNKQPPFLKNAYKVGQLQMFRNPCP